MDFTFVLLEGRTGFELAMSGEVANPPGRREKAD